jgi:two-component system, LuxR family, sensor kinase FixL
MMRPVAQSASDAIVTSDKQGAISYASAALRSIFAYRSEELVGRPLEMLFGARDREGGVQPRYA